MKQDAMELVFILDRSGSMIGRENDTIGSFNSFLQKQQKLDSPCRITTVLFSDRSILLHDRIDIRAVGPLTERDYQVGGTTALLDAVGMAIDKIAAVQRRTSKPYRAGRVMFVIITDGMENASREYSLEQVRRLIAQKREHYDWEFIFLGANMDAVEVAGDYGIPRSRAASYVCDSYGTRLNFEVLDEIVCAYRAGEILEPNCLDEIRLDNGERGNH